MSIWKRKEKALHLLIVAESWLNLWVLGSYLFC